MVSIMRFFLLVCLGSQFWAWDFEVRSRYHRYIVWYTVYIVFKFQRSMTSKNMCQTRRNKTFFRSWFHFLEKSIICLPARVTSLSVPLTRTLGNLFRSIKRPLGLATGPLEGGGRTIEWARGPFALVVNDVMRLYPPQLPPWLCHFREFNLLVYFLPFKRSPPQMVLELLHFSFWRGPEMPSTWSRASKPPREGLISCTFCLLHFLAREVFFCLIDLNFEGGKEMLFKKKIIFHDRGIYCS